MEDTKIGKEEDCGMGSEKEIICRRCGERIRLIRTPEGICKAVDFDLIMNDADSCQVLQTNAYDLQHRLIPAGIEITPSQALYMPHDLNCRKQNKKRTPSQDPHKACEVGS